MTHNTQKDTIFAFGNLRATMRRTLQVIGEANGGGYS